MRVLVTELQKTNLDLKDKKILFILGKDARTPISKIAKLSGLSRDSVKYRIEKLEKERVIVGYRAVIDILKLGYQSYHLFIKLSNPSRDAEETIIKNITNLPYVRALIKFHGNFDYEIALVAKDIAEFDSILTEVIGKIEKYLQDYEILVITKNFRSGSFPKNFLKNFDFNINKENKKYLIDEKDLKILKIIRDNARLSLLDISKITKMSPDSVSYRLKNMSSMLNYIPAINYSAIGYGIYALLININNLNKEKEKTLREFFGADENILWAVKTIGRYNVLAYICVQNESDFHNTIIKLRELFPEQIKSYESLIIFSEYKYTYMPDILFKE